MKEYKFKNPPIIELVIGIQFNKKVISLADIFTFFNHIKNEYPQIQEHPILPTIVEKIGGPNEMKFLSGFNSRKFFISKSNDKLIQIQPDRFLLNWRKNVNNNKYPSFSNIYTEFMKYLNLIDKISKCKENVNQLEITYIDHILLSDFGLKTLDISEILNLVVYKNPLNTIDCIISLPYTNINGNLSFKIQNAIRKSDKKEILLLETACRGIYNGGINNIDEWFDQSHGILTDFFLNIITDKAKDVWGYLP